MVQTSSFQLPRRFWWLYSAAWLPYLAGNVVLFMADADADLMRALEGAVSYVVPAALLGVVVLRITGRLAQPTGRAVAFLAGQAGLSLAYSSLFAIIQVLVDALRTYAQSGTWTFRLQWIPWYLVTGVTLYCALAAVAWSLRTAEGMRRQEARAARAEALRAEAELEALRARLNPHFLFNTLHSLLALVRSDPQKAEEALEQFGDLLRYALRVHRKTLDRVTLAEEWKFVGDYLELETLRLGDRLRLDLHLDEGAAECAVPVFTLQPLVENAVHHAIAPRAAGGTVRISARREGDELAMTVADDGPGTTPERLAEAKGVGLRVVRQRLETLTGGSARVEIDTGVGTGFSITVRLPAASLDDEPLEASS